MAEQTNTTKAHATIVHIEGKAYLRDASGKTVPLKEGQQIDEKQVLVTDSEGRIQLQLPNGELVDIGPARTVLVDAQMLNTTTTDATTAAINDLAASTAKIASAIANGQDLSTELDPTAAGLNGAGASEGHSFVQLSRIAEGVDPLSFNFDNNSIATTDLPLDQGTTQPAIQAVNDALTLEEDGESRINVLGNDIGGGLKVNTAVANNGTVTINPDGTLSYKPNANYNGNDQITYTITDANGTSSTAIVTITVTPVNDLPKPTDSNGNPLTIPVQISTKEDTPIAGKVTATDPDGDTLTYAPKDQPTHGTVTVNPDGSYVYTPAPDYNGKDSFTVTVNDGKGGTATITVDVTVDPVNDAPIGTNQAVSTPEDTPITGKLVATDKDGDPLTFVAKDQPTHGTVTVKPDGSYEYTPAPDYNGKDSFTVTVNDGKGGTTTLIVDVTVDPVNDAPIGTNQAVTTPEDTPITGKLVATDKDGDPLTFVAKDQPTHGSVTVKPDGSYEYTPAPDYNGKDSFTVTVNDGKGGTTTLIVDVTVNPVNDAPIPTDPKLPGESFDPITGNYAHTTPEDTAVKGKVVATDADGDALTYTLSGQPNHGTVDFKADGTYTYTPSKDYNGKDSFSVLVDDGHGGKVTSIVNIDITPVNDAPEVDPSSGNLDPATGHYTHTAKEDTVINGKVIATDVDGDKLTYSAKDQPTHGSVTVNADGSYVYTPNLDYIGKDQFTVTVSDGKGGTTTAVIDLNFTPGDAPVANPDAATTKEDTALVLTADKLLGNDSAGDNGPLKLTSVSNPSNGTVVLNADGTVTFTPAKDFNGDATFNYSAVDKNGNVVNSSVTVNVTPVNDAPEVDPSSGNIDPATGHYTHTAKEDTVINGKVVATDVDGDKLTYSAKDQPTHGSVTVNADGSYVYTPNLDYIGKDQFTVTVADGKGGTTTAVIDLNFTPGDAPVANPDAATTKEDTALVLTADKLLGNDSAGDNGPLKLTSVSNPSNGTVVLNADGTVTFTPAKDFNGDATFNYSAVDKNGNVVNSSVTVNVTPVNDAPEVDPSSGNLDPATGHYTHTAKEDTVINGKVVATDVDGDKLTYSAKDQPTHGSVTVNADGSYVYTPNLDYIGKDQFTVSVADGKGGTTTAIVDLNFTPGDAPIANPDTATTKEDTALVLSADKLLGNDSAGDNGPLKLTSVSNPSNGTVVLNADGTVTFTPAKDFNGDATFNYSAVDKNGNVVNSSVTVNVTPVNDAPEVDPSSGNLDPATGHYTHTAKEDTVINGKVVATDVDGDKLIYSAKDQPTHGSVTVNADGSYVYTPNLDYIGKDQFTVTVADGKGGTTTAVIDLNFTPGDAPVANPDAATTKEDTALVLTADKLLGNDSAGDNGPLKLTSVSNPSNGTVVLNTDGTVTFTPAKDFNGDATFNYSAQDKNGNVVNSSVTVNVTPVNDAPEVDPSSGNIDPATGHYTHTAKEDTVIKGKVVATDVDGDKLTYSAKDQPTHGSVTVNADGSYVYTPNLDYIGKDQFTVTVSDGKGGTTTAVIDLNFTPGDAPVANPDAATTKEDTALILSADKLLGNDSAGDNGPLKLTSVSNPSNGTVVLNADGTVTFTPAKDFNGDATFNYSAQDKNGNVVNSSVTVNVTPVNDAPEVDPSSGNLDPATGHYTHTAKEDTVINGKVVATDVDGDKLTYSAKDQPAHGSVVVNADGSYVYTPNLDYIGKDQFTVTVSDGKGGTTTAVIDLNFTPGDAPVANPDTATTKEDTALILSADKLLGNDSAGDNGPLKLTSVSNPSNGTVVLNADGTVTFTPAKDFNGDATFNYSAVDKNGNVVNSSVTVNVTPVNDAPEVDPSSGNIDPATGHYTHTAKEDTVIKGKVVATDVDGDKLTYSAKDQPTHGSVTVNADGSYVYTPNLDYIGKDQFTVTVSDGKGGTTTAVIDLNFTPGDAPVANPDAATTKEDTALILSADKLLGNDSAGDNGPLKLTSVSNPSNGTVVLNADGTVTFTPAKDFNGDATFNYSAQDKNGNVVNSSVTVNVTPVNDAPEVDPSSGNLDPATGHYTHTAKEDTVINGKVIATDVDGDKLTYSAKDQPTHGSVTVNADGSYVYTPNLDYIGKDQFTVTVSDGKGGTTTAVIDLNFTPGDAPVANPDTATTKEDTALVLSADKLLGNDSAGDNGPLKLTSVSNPSNGTVVLNADGTVTFTPAKDFNGDATFNYSAVDKNGNVVNSSVTVNVTPVNDAPEVDPSSGNIDPATGHYTHTAKEDTVINGKVIATDVDGDKLTYSAKDQPTHGSVTVNADGSYVYTPNLDYIGKDQFTVTVSDGKGGTTTAIVDLNFTPGDAPVANPDAATTKEDTALVLTADKLLGNDSAGDNGPLKLTSVSNPSNGTVVLNADGTVTFTPAKDFNGDATFNYSAVDKNGNVVNSSVTVNVTPENDAPVPTDPKLPGEGFDPITGNYAHTTPEDTAVKGKVVATDADGDKLTYTVSGQPTHGTVDFKADGTYTYTPSKDYNGKDSFSVLVDDGHGGKVTSIVNIDITPVNDAPTTSGGTISGSEDTYLVSGTGGFTWASFNIKDVDSADSALSIKITSLPADGKLQFFNGTGWENISSNNSFNKSDIDGGKLRFVPDANESGGNSFNTAGTGDQKSHYAAFNYEVSDGSQKSSAEMRVDIKPVADAPIISIGGISLVNGSTSTVTPPKGNGLTQQYYAPDANDNLNTTTARTPTRIETELEGKVPTTTTIVTTPDVYVPNGASAPSGIATDSAYRVSGLVYLEEGKTYTFSGYVDDTSLLKIGGVELMNRPYDGYGNFTATPFVPGKSGYYTVEMIVYNASNVGALDLNVSVNGGKTVDFNTSNFPLYSNLAQLESNGGLHSNLVATGDGGYYPQGISGQEDSFIKLFGLAAKLSDTDGSESLQSLSLTELKAGSTVYDGVRTYSVPSDGSSLNLKGWDLNNLQIRPPRDFFGDYKVGLQAVSVENSTGETATNNAFVSIQVANTNDAPSTSDDSVSIREDSTPNPITGNVLSNDIDVDGDKLVVQAINNIAANVGNAVSGQFGQLTINADGSYRYTLDNSNPRVNALNDKDTLSEKFTYTVSDGKGGTSTATLTINIQGHTDPVVIMGSSYNDQIGDMYGESNSLWTGEKTEGTVIDLQLGGGAISTAPNPNPGQRFQYTQSVDQVIDAGGGNDYVESGRGDDVIYAGDSDSAGYKFADILGHKLMTLDLGALVDPTTQLFSAAVGVSNPKADVVNGGSGHDAIFGQTGVDLLYGHTGNDYLDGGSDNDALRGGLGNDVLRGGAGNDVLKGDAGDDVFLWMPGDQAITRGATAAGTGNEFGIGVNVNVVKTATDVVLDFNQNTTVGNNDKLDLRDLLIGETHGSNDIGNLLDYLHVEKSGSSTVIHISTAGEFKGAYNAAKEDQTIILQGVDLTGATETDILKNLLQNNKLIVD